MYQALDVESVIGISGSLTFHSIVHITRNFSLFILALVQLKEFNEKHPAGSGARAQQQAEERVMANIQWRKENEDDVGNWLKDYLEANNIPLNQR